MKNTLLLLMMIFPCFLTGQYTYYCGQDTIYNIYHNYVPHGDTAWIIQDNPYGYKVTVSLDVWEWDYDNASNQVCIDLDGQAWCSAPIGNKGWQHPYGYMEYEDGQLIKYGLDSAQIPVDFRFIRTRCHTYQGATCRIEDGFARVTFTTTAKKIKWGLFMPSSSWFSAGSIYPRCRVEEVPQGQGLVRYYDMTGREVVPQSTGIYIKTQGIRGQRGYGVEKVHLSEYDLNNLDRS